MEDWEKNKVVLELIELAQTPEQIVWLKTVSPEATKDVIEGLRELVKIAEQESVGLKTEVRNLQRKYESHLSLNQVTAIIKALGYKFECDC